MTPRRGPVAVVTVTLAIIALCAIAGLAQAPSGNKKIDATVTDPQAAIKAAAAAFKLTKADPNFAPKKTAWGDPDISGTYLTATYTPLQRPQRLKDKAFFTEEEAIAELARVIGQDAEVDPRNVHYDWKEYGMDGWQSPIRPSLRTSLIVDPPDGRIPSLSAEGQKRRADRLAAARLRAPEVSVRTLASTYTRCITGNSAGGPLVRGGNPDPVNTTGSEAGVTAEIQILQSPGYASIITQSGSDVRIIPLDGRPFPPSTVHAWLGVSRGHWEGNTLVVETRNFNDKTPAANFQGSTENLKMTERFTVVNPGTLKYEYTLEDPRTWTRAWSAEALIPKIPPGIFEFACHESNYGVFNVVRGAQTREKELIDKGLPIGAAGGGGGAQ
ncbi:MAG TPA: hypothetical protein VN654_29390 [Vicinamibacterales bacterium]|nr:hypothetical protein [Vicinamibacterales bacterium]